MRVLFRRRQGFRNVRGGHIIDLQIGLARQVANPPTVDGVFGPQTDTAIKVWQSSAAVTDNGIVDEATWRGILGREPPSMFRRALAFTAAFEGHGYTFAAGNWDGAFLTWGVVGFTLKGGNFGVVIRRVLQRHPGLLQQVMGAPKADELSQVIDASDTRKRNWANGISLPPTKYRVRADWEDAFEALGNRSEVRSIQDEVAWEVYWHRGVADLKKFGKFTELDAALFFDTSVQNGGVNDVKADKIRSALNANPGASGRQRLSLIADAIAEGSSATFREDVRSRRQAIARGRGLVHGAEYFAEDWAIAELPVTEQDLATR
jgi:Putative peptidoglycan binding domain